MKRILYLIVFFDALLVGRIAFADDCGLYETQEYSMGNMCISADLVCGYSITTSGGASEPMQACSGACPTWGHAPYLASEGPFECDGAVYLNAGGEFRGNFTVEANGSISRVDDVLDHWGTGNDWYCGFNTSLTPDAYECCGTGTASTECISISPGNTADQVDIATSTGVTTVNASGLTPTFAGIATTGHASIAGQISSSPGPLTNVAPAPGVIQRGQHSFPLATTAANKIGALAVICGGMGSATATISDYTNVTSITFTINHDGAWQTPVTYTVAGTWSGCVTSNAVCAKALYTLVNANLATLIGVEAAVCNNADCTDGIVGFRPLVDTCALTLADVGTGVTTANGAVGSVSLGAGWNSTYYSAPAMTVAYPGVGSALLLGTNVGTLLGGIATDANGVLRPVGSNLGTTSIAMSNAYISAAVCGSSSLNACTASKVVFPSDGVTTFSKATDTGNFKIDTTGTVKGQTITTTSVAADCVFVGGGGGTTCATSAFIPIGASVIGISGRQVTANTTCTTCTAGANMGGGLDADQYGTALECDVNDTLYTAATATANVMGTCYLAGGCTITMTAVGGNCVGGTAAWTAHYIATTAASTD